MRAVHHEKPPGLGFAKPGDLKESYRKEHEKKDGHQVESSRFAKAFNQQ